MAFQTEFRFRLPKGLPDPDTGQLKRDGVMRLARNELKLEVCERSIDRSELYMCEELFFCGTGVEIAPIVQIDYRPVGDGEVGAITNKLRSLYVEATRGRMPAYQHWLWPVYSDAAIEKTA